jgi:hypothetical protein
LYEILISFKIFFPFHFLVGQQQQQQQNQAPAMAVNFSSSVFMTNPALAMAQFNTAENKCLRCSNLVYALERIGPIKGNIYHKTCFKCLICDRQLDLKTYYTNQIDLNDRQIYCQSHAPKSGKGVFGADNIYIHSVLNAPKLDVMQKVDNKPKVSKSLFKFITKLINLNFIFNLKIISIQGKH